MFRLEGKTALVTGASQGIGKTIALHLAERGARVAVAARSVDKLEALAEEITAKGGEAKAVALDVAQPETVADQLKELGDDWPIDILVNNAGITRDALLARMTVDAWQEVLATNLTGSFVVTKALLRGMMRRRWGRVIFVSSVVGLMGNVGQANYAASKAGVIGFCKSLAREYGGRQITANVIAPGYIETAMTGVLDDNSRKALTEQIVARRIGTVEDVATTAVFLASEEAGYITGNVVNVSGGLYI